MLIFFFWLIIIILNIIGGIGFGQKVEVFKGTKSILKDIQDLEIGERVWNNTLNNYYLYSLLLLLIMTFVGANNKGL